MDKFKDKTTSALGLIYTAVGPGLGDLWMTINYLLRESERLQKEIKLSLQNYENHYDIRLTPIQADKKDNREASFVYDIINSLEHNGQLRLVNQMGNCRPSEYWSGFQYFPTKIKWNNKKHGRICYQLDGRTLKEKNPPQEDIHKLTSISNLEFIKLGLPLTINQSLDIAKNCDLFLGICSGYSHVCHSLGIPTFLIQYNYNIEKWHKNQKYTLCNGTQDAINKVDKYLTNA